MDTIFYLLALAFIPWIIGVFIALVGVLVERYFDWRDYYWWKP